MENKINEWAIIELYGHNKIAGRISEQQIAGCSFIRVDVPAFNGRAAFTKFFGSGAIYAITITDEETARAAVSFFAPEPIDRFSARQMIEAAEAK
ncbi:MAG: hypothetical protein WC900_10390, partial [Oscillospiraceae bacterium]